MSAISCSSSSAQQSRAQPVHHVQNGCSCCSHDTKRKWVQTFLATPTCSYATLGSLQPQPLGFLNRVDPLDSATIIFSMHGDFLLFLTNATTGKHVNNCFLLANSLHCSLTVAPQCSTFSWYYIIWCNMYAHCMPEPSFNT